LFFPRNGSINHRTVLRQLLAASNPPSRHGSGSALSATGNRLGRTPDPHRCNIIGLRPPTN
ncbi:hypothetical protein, partial [Escherichia coli]|uniref:hypothetical protein n=1 Tax=Escherichia coli TaxID=562 RepID=UPI002ACBEC07